MKEQVLTALRPTVIPIAWAMVRRIPGGARFWEWCLKVLNIPPRPYLPPAKPTRPDPPPQPDKIAYAQTSAFYGKDYFDRRKDVFEESGYDLHLPGTLEPEIAKAAQGVFQAQRVLDVGCAKGFAVEALRKIGLDARGVDFSEYAISRASKSVADYVTVGNVLALDFPPDAFDLVLCFETLEHLSKENVEQAASELHRVTSDKVWITTPALGVNDYGPPPAWPQGKIQEPFVPLYESDQDFPDPALQEHLLVDRHGFPLQGHITIASFRWWTETFLRHGYIRCGDLERIVNTEIEQARTGWLDCMVFEKVRAVSRLTEELSSVRLNDLMSGDANGDLIWDSGSPRAAQSDSYEFAPGQYSACFGLSIADIPSSPSPWSQVLICEVRSRDGMRMHGLRVIRLLNLGGQRQERFCVPFGCNEPVALSIRATSPGRVKVRLNPVVAVRSERALE